MKNSSRLPSSDTSRRLASVGMSSVPNHRLRNIFTS